MPPWVRVVREGSHCCHSTQQFLFKIHFPSTLTGPVCNEHLSDTILNQIAKLGHVFGNVTLLATSGQVSLINKSKSSIPTSVGGCAQLQARFPPPSSTWGAAGLHVVHNGVLQGCHDALVGFLEGRDEVVHFPKEPAVDAGRCLQSRGER